MSFYLRWKYPKSARIADKRFFYFLLIFFPIIVYYNIQGNKFIKKKDVWPVQGTLNKIMYPNSSRDHIATVVLNEHPKRLFSFDMKAFNSDHIINLGDSVKLLVSKKDLENNLNEVRSYELTQTHKLIFTLDKYNNSISDNNNFYKFLVGIALVFIALYLILEKTGLIPKILNLMNSPDPTFKPENEKPNFNEFLDR